MNRRRAWVALSALALVACSSSEPSSSSSSGPPPPPQTVISGDFVVTVIDGDRLVVASKDGRVLLDGLAPADPEGDDPRAGFAVRDATTSYEMMFGAFQPTDHDKGPWRTAQTLAVKPGGAVELDDADGAVLARLTFTTPDDGHLVVDVEPGDGPERRFSWGYACAATDHFAGFGAQSMDVDHRGFTVPTWVEEQGVGKEQDDSYGPLWYLQGTRHASQIPIPQVLSSRGYILTTKTDLRSVFSLCSDDPNAARVEVDLPLEVDVFDGPKPADAIDRATRTFGRPRTPPKIAFAPWLDAIFGSAGVRDIAGRARAANIPASVVWTEDWRGGEWDGTAYRLQEEWDVDTTLYPDMQQLSADLHGEGLAFYVYFNPFVYQGSRAWPEVQPNGWLVKHTDGTDYTFTGAKLTTTGLLDVDDPDAQAWAIGKMQAAIALGADGWMNDFGEWLPTDGVTHAGPSLPRHNPYPVAWQQIARDAIDGVDDGTERLFFSRSGWFGTPPLADVIWAGDQRTDFETDDGMPTVLPIGIGLGLVGVSTFGSDVAGYQSATNPVGTKELFFRWTELGAWSPVMRTHHGTNPTTYEQGATIQQWAWWIDADSTEHFRKYAALHMALVPYLQGLAKVASTSGLPMWRSMVIAFGDDARSWGVKDQVMLGDGVLIAPVMTAGATSRDVVLPAGRWFPWDGGAGVTGGATTHAAAALGDIPVYAAAGAVVPMFPDGVMTLAFGSAAVPDDTSVGDDRVVDAFLGASGQFTEAGGLAYALAHTADATGALAFAWQAQPLSACASPAVAPCFEASSDGAIVHVTGPGALDVTSDGAPAAKLTATGGAADRALTWVVRR